jgi:ADP-ribose pyrophosphatase YjhB (NUDIX family)
MTSADSADPMILGVIVVIEMPPGIVFVHPANAPADAPGSLVGGPCEPGETPEHAAIRYAAELTGLEVELTSELARFVQEGTPFGTGTVVSYVATATGGALRGDGAEGPAVVYALEELPAIVPIRVANQRVLDAYLEGRSRELESPA